MDIRKLRHAALLAETLHFARAAERAHLTQSALSRSVQALESALGLRLFDRQIGSGGVSITAAGRALMQRALPLLRQANDLDRDMALLRDASLGELPIGAGPFPSVTLLPAVLADLQQSHPGLSVNLQVDHTGALRKLLEADQIELFVAQTLDMPREGLDVRPLMVQTARLFCRAEHPLARRRRLSPIDLAEQRMASVHLPGGAAQEALWRATGLPGKAAMALVCDNVYLLKDFARRSDVLLVSTEESLAAELASGEFVRLPLTGLRPVPVSVNIVTRKRRTLSPGAALLIKRLEDVSAGAGRP